MRRESLRHSALPCDSLESDQFHEETYRVASTEAVVNLSSSITLIYLYCSRLPADGLVCSLLPLHFFLYFDEPKICFLLHQSGSFSLFSSRSSSFIPFRLNSQVLQTNSEVGRRDWNVVSSQELPSTGYSGTR